MTPRVENALKAATDTKALLVAPGALREIAPLFRAQFGAGARAIIVADTNTHAIAGAAASALLRGGGVPQDGPLVLDARDLHAEYCHVETVLARLRATDAVPVAVGSGTVNDLCKLASHLAGRPYMVAGTAASMDGYTSFGASITKDGAKQTMTCPAPRAALADLDIMARAPAEMTAAGYADLFAKITGGADWLVADAAGADPLNPVAWDLVQGGLPPALSDPAGVRAGDPVALGRLVEGLMLGGFAMQYAKSSRPASGAEHYISHIWDMEHHRHNGRGVSHGFQVAIGTITILAFYEELLKIDLAALDAAAAAAAWPEFAGMEKTIHALYGGGSIGRILSESRAKYTGRQAVAAQLELIKRAWPGLKTRLEKQLVPVAEAQRRLAAAGVPTEPEHIGISRSRLRETLLKAPYFRNRFTAIDLAQRAGLFGACVSALFGPGGRWEIK
ncbi:MAG: sn-glycerol-1-phosphate dehydrogenase [Opitutaceae bacterium]|jgi:glycerol-1-phosphate dehydrogenase [NAD(P)+]|nr:sn-glycerol-1-phosphate dehydrogenase [Opitutaceae bacterium]